jgi:hypothetical protein
MKQKRRRAAGGGRKPSGPFKRNAAQLSIRMPADMRAELEAAAQKRGRSLTQELLVRLQVSLSKKRLARHDQATRALCFLFSHVADLIAMPSRHDWYRNPYLFRAFKFAVAKLLDALEPPGEIQPPFHILSRGDVPSPGMKLKGGMAAPWETPEGMADVMAAATLTTLSRPQQLEPQAKATLRHALPPDVAEMIIEEFEDNFYGMSDVRRDLGMKEPEAGPAWLAWLR